MSELSSAKPERGRAPVSNALLLMAVTVFQIITFSQPAFRGEPQLDLLAVFGAYIAIEWAYVFVFYHVFKRRSFEPELIAFFLSGIGLTVCASVYKPYAVKQLASIAIGLALFIFMVWLMSDIKRVTLARVPLAVASVLLFGLNLVIAPFINGAKNWITLGGVSFQPSELIKIAFIFVGASTLDRLQTTKNLTGFIVFSGVCIGALFVLRDFGTALIYFFTFLIISFMRSAKLHKIILMCVVAVLGAVMLIQFRPYVLARFSTWRHIWEVPDGGGFQQTRTLIYMASGGLLGAGIGNGYLKRVDASTTDLVFGVLCEEWGLILGLIVIAAFAALVVYSCRCCAASRSSFFAIATCAAGGLLLFQVCLNVFGATDIIPFTGVTLPFISRGGSSVISTWGLLAFIKVADTRIYEKEDRGERTDSRKSTLRGEQNIEP